MSICEQYELCELSGSDSATLVGFRRAVTPWIGVSFELWAWDAAGAEVRRRCIAGRVQRVLHSGDSAYFVTTLGTRYRVRRIVDGRRGFPEGQARAALYRALRGSCPSVPPPLPAAVLHEAPRRRAEGKRWLWADVPELVWVAKKTDWMRRRSRRPTGPPVPGPA